MRVFLDVFNWGLPRKIGYTVVFKVEYVGKDVKDEGRCGYILGLFMLLIQEYVRPSTIEVMLKLCLKKICPLQKSVLLADLMIARILYAHSKKIIGKTPMQFHKGFEV